MPESLTLSAQDLHKTYGKREVVKGISLNVHSGESVAILGPNGAGKTTCFYMMIGLVKPSEGSVFLNDADITHLPTHIRARFGLGYLPQESSIFTGLTVEQNILAALELFEPNKQTRLAKLETLIDELKISKVRKQNSTSLSGGERRRLEIARCLAMSPSFILLDEPFAGIDPVSVADVREIVSHLKEKGIGVLITDHNVHETLKMVDRVYIVYDGKILTEGHPSDIVNHHDVKKYYLGNSGH